MQVILLEKIRRLGELGQVVEVKRGFARNYLIPSGKATRASPEAIKEFENKRKDLELKAKDLLKNAEINAEKLKDMEIIIEQKAGVDGRLFGSVTNIDITEAIKKLGHEVVKSMVQLPSGPLKKIGDYKITLSLHSDVQLQINVKIIPEA